MKDNGKTDKNGNAIADFERGGWDKNLTGFWIAKYEMSMETNGTNTVISNTNTGNVATSSTVKAVSKPGVTSWRSINVANCYANSLNYDTSKKSHLIKNSEWGAVSYLTQSTYGRNGHEIDINNSSTYITGNGGGSTNAKGAANVTNAYNTVTGAKASTTGNVYGVNGGSYEYTAIFNKAYSGDYFTNASYKSASGSHFATTNGNSTEYATTYSNNSASYYGTSAYRVTKTGDGIKEIYTGTSDISWYNDYAAFSGSGSPFARRGGTFDNGANAGVFCSYHVNGNAGNSVSFRAVLAL